MSDSAESNLIHPKGNIIAAVSRELREKMQQMINDGVKEITIDMADVELIDSTGIGVLIGIQNTLNSKSGKLYLKNVCNDIMKMLRIMRLDRHITIVDSK